MMKKLLVLTVLAAVIGTAAVIGGGMFYGARTINELLGENRRLRQAIANLTDEGQIGYAKVVRQEPGPDGILHTTLRFIETDRDDPHVRILEKEYTMRGDVIHFDALVVTFPRELVMDGRERSLYLWRRVYGEHQAPAEGFPIEDPGQEPARYRDLLIALDRSDRRLFWDAVWDLANDPEALSAHGIRAIYGNAVYKSLRPGLVYSFKINNLGQLTVETLPAL